MVSVGADTIEISGEKLPVYSTGTESVAPAVSEGDDSVIPTYDYHTGFVPDQHLEWDPDVLYNSGNYTIDTTQNAVILDGTFVLSNSKEVNRVTRVTEGKTLNIYVTADNVDIERNISNALFQVPAGSSLHIYGNGHILDLYGDGQGALATDPMIIFNGANLTLENVQFRLIHFTPSSALDLYRGAAITLSGSANSVNLAGCHFENIDGGGNDGNFNTTGYYSSAIHVKNNFSSIEGFNIFDTNFRSGSRTATVQM